MNKSDVFLNKIYKNASVGVNTLDVILPKIHSEDFKTIISYQRGKYFEIAQNAQKLLAKKGLLPPEIGLAEKIGLWTVAEMNKTESKSAEAIINACTAGILEITRLLNSSEADKQIADLAHILTDTEQKSIYYVMKYL